MQIVCSPDQSVHVNVTRTFQNPDKPLPGVAEQYVYLSEATASGFHGSCEDVVFPQTNSKRFYFPRLQKHFLQI